MEEDSILVKPWYNCRSSPEIGSSAISSRKEMIRESSRLETDLSNHHKREITRSIDRDFKEESFGPYQNRTISIMTGGQPAMSPISDSRARTNQEMHINLNDNTKFLNNFSTKTKRAQKNKNGHHKMSVDRNHLESLHTINPMDSIDVAPATD